MQRGAPEAKNIRRRSSFFNALMSRRAATVPPLCKEIRFQCCYQMIGRIALDNFAVLR
jgi:hypothetical protein